MTELDRVDLIKKVDLFKRRIESYNFNGLTCQLTACLDVSGSMQADYRKGGYMDMLMKRFVSLAMVVDPDKKVGVIAFDWNAYQLPDMDLSKYDSYLDIIRYSDDYWNTTAYDAALNMFYSKSQTLVQKGLGLFGFNKQSKKPPRFVAFFTDGEPDSIKNARNALYRLHETNTYIQFIGVGEKRNFEFLEQMAEELDYVGFVHFAEMNSITDEQFAEKFLHEESLNWIKGNM